MAEEVVQENHMRLDGGRRVAAYANDFDDVLFMLSLNPEKYSEEEQDAFGQFIMRAIVAYIHFLKNEQKIIEMVNQAMLAFPRWVSRKWGGVEFLKKVQESMAYAMSLVMGYAEYEKSQDDWSQYGPTVHIGDPGKVH